jgi:hypothetical protein
MSFETANRAFFEATINARPACYYAPGGVEDALALALEDARADRGYQFLLKNGQGAILGRVNLGQCGARIFNLRCWATGSPKPNAAKGMRAKRCGRCWESRSASWIWPGSRPIAGWRTRRRRACCYVTASRSSVIPGAVSNCMAHGMTGCISNAMRRPLELQPQRRSSRAREYRKRTPRWMTAPAAAKTAAAIIGRMAPKLQVMPITKPRTYSAR